MDGAGTSATRRADRFHWVSLVGLVLSGYLALAWSEFLEQAWAGAVSLALLCLLAGLFWLAARHPGGFVWIKLVACLELLAAALLSASLSFFLFLTAFLFLLVAAQASGEIGRSAHGGVLVARGGLRRFSLRLAAMTTVVGLGILGVTAALFFVMPRTAQAALNRLAAGRYRLPGFSGVVRLGDMGSVLSRNTPAMHVRFVDSDPRGSLKWRGTVLSSFDGREWTRPVARSLAVPLDSGRVILADDDQRRRTGKRVTYEVQLEAISTNVLFFAGAPEVLWIGAPSVSQTPEGVYRLSAPPARRLRYGAVGYLDPLPPSVQPGGEYLQLPPLDRRIEKLAREATDLAPSDAARAVAMESYLRRHFRYTTELPSSRAADPLAHFLFERRSGHCEYFATSMAVMLRILGIPSRLVTGFQGGQLNPITGWYVVRASDAHAWVEAWIQGKGWTTFDPTPGVAAGGARAYFAKLLFYADTAEMFWQEWVVDYDLERQVTLAARMHTSGRIFSERWLDGVRLGCLRWQTAGMRALRLYGGVALATGMLALALYLLGPKARQFWRVRRRLMKARDGQANSSDATLLYQRMLRQLKRRGYQKPAWATPGEFVCCLPPSETAEVVSGFTAAYHDLRYGGHQEAARRMITLLERLERTVPASRGPLRKFF